MTKTYFNTEEMTERLESLKAGIIGGVSLCLAFLVTAVVNNFLLKEYFPLLSNLPILRLNFNFLVSGAIATFSGLLFGVTYRYIIRQDNNPHLKSGGVMAFGLVRGLGEVEIGLNISDSIFPFVILGTESILWFALAASFVDTAIKLRWIKPFASN
ncbi:MAG: hypothetical protein QNJ47_17035 [Nostocaceae cyanobacterium]|nr:hypothetical protein [Nostocaceae cyanobacterium]